MESLEPAGKWVPVYSSTKPESMEFVTCVNSEGLEFSARHTWLGNWIDTGGNYRTPVRWWKPA